MKVVNINGETGESIILIGERLERLKEYIPLEKAFIITDSNVRQIYKNQFPEYEIIEIGTGEKIKILDTVKDIYARLLELEADRSSFIIGIGGGIVCDIAGFVASTYMRGVRFGFVSSTLLSQVDASVGGKNGLNFEGYKNIIGVFNQPEFVICDLELLKTLPVKEVRCGMAEIVKHGAIADERLFSYIENHTHEAVNLDIEVIERFVHDSVMIKSSIVNRDEKEKGERKKLNFGHTFGHAIEKVTGAPHGDAISIGMVVASRLSAERGKMPLEHAKRIEGLLDKLGLPIRIDFNKDEILSALRKDKKRAGENIDFVLLEGIGQVVVEKIALNDLEKVVMDL
jgi:3-dehydroquinate synthase